VCVCFGLLVQGSLEPGESSLLCLGDYYCECKSTTPRGVGVPYLKACNNPHVVWPESNLCWRRQPFSRRATVRTWSALSQVTLGAGIISRGMLQSARVLA
jgi:hypothetical protein